MNKKQLQTKQARVDLRHLSEVWLMEKVDDQDKLKQYFKKILDASSILKIIEVLKEISEMEVKENE